MSKPGKQNLEQTSQQLAKQQGKNDVEFSTDDFQTGNSQSQSQKKSGKQKNKK
ncbi:hypothetical protein [Bacillus sp. SG-1]|uniref:hypothetical protein n=1 Tax=Bacillus sp. SG-1 TaxID=161544 RepID=UPI0001544CE1|nr:hypothetical protein [Bacillus sp. SG-1]EDL64383.1 hypothetical protein BSG1_21525 [Bacillus sp. SG-1]